MKFLSIALIGSALFISGAATAKDHSSTNYPASADHYYGLYQNPAAALSRPSRDSADFDQSGTRGRQGQGASPFNPEGPGNVTD